MSQPGKVDLSMFEGPPPAAPRYRSAQPAVQQNPFAPAQPAAQPNPFTQPAAAADPFSPPPAPAPADPFSPPPAAPDPFSPPPNGFRGASAAPIADNPFAPAAPAAPVDNPFFGGPSDDAAGGSDSLLGALDPDAAQPEESLTVGEIEARLPAACSLCRLSPHSLLCLPLTRPPPPGSDPPPLLAASVITAGGSPSHHQVEEK